MRIAIEIVSSLIILAGVILAAALLNDPRWKKAAFVAVFLLGALHIALLIANSERASAVVGMVFDGALSILSARPVQFIVALIAGASVGWWLRAQPRFRRVPQVDGRKWLKAYEALQLADEKIVEAHAAERAAIETLNQQMNKVVEEYEAAEGSVEKTSEAMKNRDAINLKIAPHNEKRSHFWIQMQNSVHNKLAAGELIAKGFLMPVKPDTEPTLIPVDQWHFLRLTGDFTEATGKGISYVGVTIAKATNDVY